MVFEFVRPPLETLQSGSNNLFRMNIVCGISSLGYSDVILYGVM